jgi:glycosyltransferase involved in cell wall biosynthesis
MRVLYTVHRYGEEVVGGAETACRLFAEKLVERGHSVDVLTSCAVSYVDWANHYAPGPQVINGVQVHRVPVSQQRDPAVFAKLHGTMMRDPGKSTIADQMEWLDAMGPLLQGQESHLRRLAARADVAVFMTYLYPTTAYGVPVLAGDIPVVIQPTAHDEPPARVPFFIPVMRSADALLYLTEEEGDVASRAFGVSAPSVVTGIGLDMDGLRADGRRFRQKHNLGDDPYLLYVGRVDTFKGVSELMRYFVEYKGRNPSNLRLVLAGEQVMELPDVTDIRYVGFLDEGDKADAIDGCIALMQPSPYESFSIVLCEAWRGGRPVLVQGFSEVLTGQCLRSQGGLPYNGFAEFEGCVRRILDDPILATELGANGYEYVRKNYSWDVVMERFEQGLELGRQHHVSKRRWSTRA